MSQRSNQNWGLANYEVPVIHFDSSKEKRKAELYEIANGKKKAPKPKNCDMTAKRGGAFTHVEKHSLAVPPPWYYNITQKWISGYANKRLGDITPRAQKKLGYKWLNTPADAQTFDKQGPQKQNKLNMDCKKNTFIEQIIHFNSKKSYPLPSPCSYNLTEKLAKKFYPDNADIMFSKPKDANKKTNLPKAARNFILVARGADKQPAPSAYNPEPVMTDCEKKVKNKHEFLSYKKYKDHTGDTHKRHKEVKEREDARHGEIISKLSGIIVKNPKPLPNDYVTFEK